MKTNKYIKNLILVGILLIFVGLIIIGGDNKKMKVNNISYTDVNLIERRVITESGLSGINATPATGGLQRIEVYEGKTREEVINQLNRSLGGALSGKANIIVDKALSLGVDPYVAAAIMVHESANGKSRIARNCNNFGGQKGAGCNGWKAYPSVRSGIEGMIQNMYNNYYSKGLNTIDKMASRYAESPAWPAKIHSFVNKLKSA